MRALTFDATRESWTGSTGMVVDEVPAPALDGAGDEVLVRVKYAGFCGSDRGIWWRKEFGLAIDVGRLMLSCPHGRA